MSKRLPSKIPLFLGRPGPCTKTRSSQANTFPSLTPPSQSAGRWVEVGWAWGSGPKTRACGGGGNEDWTTSGELGTGILWFEGGQSGLTFARLRRLVRRPSGVSAIPVSMGVADPGTAVGPA